MERRNFIKNAGVGTVASLSIGSLSSIVTSCSPEEKKTLKDDAPQALFIGDDIAVADTSYGKVRGFIMNDIYTFLGIPYGADTSGKNRFMPPVKPEPWTDVKPSVFYGNTAPQRMDNRWPNHYSTFVDHWNFWDLSENCLCLNVWTPALVDGKKRPVLVWFHGGGFASGSGIEQDGYHGENISKAGDIVFCSVNHRLGPLGFSDLSGVGGEKYKDSGNVGLLDLIASLDWVKTNISNFGGDPNNVTIMGQSGGGAKVSGVVAMPASKNLIHKAVALSGSAIEAQSQKKSRLLGEYILKKSKLSPSQIDKLQEIPWQEYMDLANSALADFNRENVSPLGTSRIGFAPVADGVHIPKGIYFSGQPGTSDIPMIYSTTFEEWNITRDNAALEKITKEEVIERLKEQYNEKTEQIYNAYAECFPSVTPVEILLFILANRKNVIKAVEAKINQSSPVYLAWFGWQPPLFDNRMRAFHCGDICFWFGNTDRMISHTGGGARPRKLSDKMMNALLSFMRTGDPSNSLLPGWKKYSKENGETMILDDTCELKNDPDRNARLSLD